MAVTVPDTARCLSCGYLLRGLPEPVCPECGTRFDPENPETYSDPARRGRTLKPLKPPTLSYLVLVGAAAAALIAYRSTAPGFYAWSEIAALRESMLILLLVLSIAFVPAHWVLRLADIRRRRRTGSPALLAAFDAHRWRWRLLTVLVLIYCATLVYPWPAVIRFWASWPALSRAADQYLVDPTFDTGPRQIGLYDVEYIRGRGQDFVCFQIGNRCSGARYGVVRYDMPPDAIRTSLRGPRRWIAPGWYFQTW